MLGTLTPSYPGGRKKLTHIGNLGTRIFGGRMGTITNATTKTYQITCALAQDFDAVRLVFANTDVHSPFITSAKVSVTSQTGVDAGAGTGTNNSAGTWVAVTKGQSPAFALEHAPLARSTVFGRIAYTVTDWIPLSSVARTDGGAYPLLVARAFCGDTAETALTTYGTGAQSYANWETKPDGRVWISRNQTGDCITDPTAFTSTTYLNQNIIVGVQYLARGQVVTVMGVGDSITEGQGTYIGEGFIMPAAYGLSNKAGVAVEYSNCGWLGEVAGTVLGFDARALDILENADIRPDILVFPNASPNDITSTISDAQITTFKSGMYQVLAACQRYETLPLLWTWLPSNTAVKTYAATDSKRIAYNTQVLSKIYSQINVVDTSTAISGIVDGTGQMQMTVGATSDDIHPNDTGNTTLAAIIKPAIAYMIGA